MQLSQVAVVRSAGFDDSSLVSCAGLVPALGLARRAGLADLVGEWLTVPGGAGHEPALKVGSLVAGMVPGADSIADMGVLRHGGMDRLFAGTRAPSTLGTFLRAFTFGHVRRLDAVAARFLAGLAAHAPIIAAGEPIAYLDIDDTIRVTYGYAKQGTGYGYSGVKGLNALLATVSTPVSAPLIVATRLCKGSASPSRSRPPGRRRDRRRHAIIEQVIADLKNGPLAHLPSGHFAANSAWLVLAAMAFNLTRALGALASPAHARATTATIRARLINIAARVTRSARRATLRLPTHWPRADA